MKAMTCEMCGSNQFTKIDGLYLCDHCGTKYTPEEAKKLMISGTVEVIKGDAEKERLLKSAKFFSDKKDYNNASKIFKELLFEYPDDEYIQQEYSRTNCNMSIDEFITLIEKIICRYKKGDFSYFLTDLDRLNDLRARIIKIDCSNVNILDNYEKKMVEKYNTIFQHNIINPFCREVIYWYMNFQNDSWGSNSSPKKCVFSSNIISNWADAIVESFLDYIVIGRTSFSYLEKESFDINDSREKFTIYGYNNAFNPNIDCNNKRFVNLFGEGLKCASYLNQNREICDRIIDNYSDISIILAIGKYYTYNDRGYTGYTHTEELKYIICSQQDLIFIKNNLCRFCGGKFKGFKNKICSKCGKPKDY